MLLFRSEQSGYLTKYGCLTKYEVQELKPIANPRALLGELPNWVTNFGTGAVHSICLGSVGPLYHVSPEYHSSSEAVAPLLEQTAPGKTHASDSCLRKRRREALVFDLLRHRPKLPSMQNFGSSTSGTMHALLIHYDRSTYQSTRPICLG